MTEEKHFRDCTTGDEEIDLSGKELVSFPDHHLRNGRHIKFCYLNDNHLTSLPESFFKHFPQLQWLDLRNNFLENLPTAGLANHDCLQVLLLQSNRIQNLPLELANVPHLSGLQISGNPIENVPFEVIAAGFDSVVDFLRKLQQRPDPPMAVSETIITKQPERRRVKKRRESKNTFSTVSSSTHSSKSPSLRSGLTCSLVTQEKITLQEKEDREKAVLRETLNRQSLMLQRIKDEEAIKTWRKLIRKESEKKFLDNFQYSPSRNFLDKSPFAVDHDMLQMLNRADIYKTLKEVDMQTRKARKQPKSFNQTVCDIESQIDSIKRKLDEITVDKKIENQAERKYFLTTRIDEINKLRSQLQKLHGKF